MEGKGASLLIALLAGSFALAPDAASAQKYPDKTIRIVVPSGPAGPTDMLARLVADQLSNLVGTTIIDNRPGGGGAIAARLVAAAEPDGYTLLMGNTAVLATIPAVSKGAAYDPLKQFTGVGQVMESYQILAVRSDFAVNSVAELIAYAKKNPDKLNYGAAGVGNTTHLAVEMFKAAAGFEAVPVQYKSGAESITALLSGDVQFVIDNVTVVRGLIEQGKLRALAVTSEKRQSLFPNVPTMLESGIKDYVITSFFGIVAPSNTSSDIVKTLNEAINKALVSETLKVRLANLGAEPKQATPAQFSLLIGAELARWKAAADASGIKVE